MYYLYRHIRLDKNEIFYIGIGKINKNTKSYSKDSEKYRRAYTTKNRNNHWLNIINFTNYDVEILFESDNRSFIIEKEKEFIKLYGRKDLNLGTLCNFTNGGEGRDGVILSKETKLKQSISAKKRMIGIRKEQCIKNLEKNHSTRGKFGKDHHRAFKVYQYSLDNTFIKVWDSMSDIKRELKFDISHISSCVNNKKPTAYKFKWFKERI
jgi:hypothetical protein